jgi:hypothetical protein
MAIERHDDTLMHCGSPTAASGDDSVACVFLGRSDELAELEEHAAHALTGTFSLVLVEGEGGIGASRFLEEAQRRVMGTRSGHADCSDSVAGAGVPRLPLLSALENALGPDEELAEVRRAAEELVARDPSATNRASHVVAFELLAALVRRHAPLVLFIDRLDLSHPLTISALGYLQRRCAGSPVAVVATCRPGTAGDGTLALLEPAGRIQLGPLSLDELGSLGLTALYERTGGHPLLLADALGSSYDDGHDRLSADACVRLAGYCSEAGPARFAALRAACELPQPFQVEPLAAVLGLPELGLVEDLEALCDANILRTAADGFAFRYEAVREALTAMGQHDAAVIDLRETSSPDAVDGTDDTALAAAS